jgi:hypothetical protein
MDMMGKANLDTKVNELLGITGGTGNAVAEIIEPKPVAVREPNGTTAEVDVDYNYSRENFYNLIEKGSDAIDGILEVAKESDHPRAFEVAGQLIKVVSEVTERLADLQEKMKKLKEVPDHGPKSVTNALFVGSTHELQKMIKANASDIDKL